MHTAKMSAWGGVGVNATTIQCFHEQSPIGMCIVPVFYLLPIDHLHKKLTKTKKYSDLEMHEKKN